MTDERGHFVGRIILKPKIWNRPLSAEEIRAEYEAAKQTLRVKGYGPLGQPPKS